MNVVLRVTKGGPGSGFHGHQGRPGHVGGSTPWGLSSVTVSQFEDYAQKLQNELGVRAHIRFVKEIDVSNDIVPVGSDVIAQYDPRSGEITFTYACTIDIDDFDAIGFEHSSCAAMGPKSVAAHETLHILDDGYNRVHSRSEQFQKLWLDLHTFVYEKYPPDTSKLVSRYSFTTDTEAFAEFGTVYLLNPEWLKTNYNDMYAYFDNLLPGVGGKFKEYAQAEDENKVEVVAGGEYYWVDRDVVEQKQLPISDASKEVLIKIRTGIFAEFSDGLSEDVYTGKISLGQWEESMKRAIRELHSSVAAIGKGGWGNMTWADWGRIGPVMKSQYRYLHGFAENIAANKESISIDAIKARARMYGNAGGFSSIMVQAGDVLAKKLPWLPKDGSTECLVNCKCYWDLIVIGEDKQWKTVQATWHLRPAEHCDDCIGRDNHVEIIQVHTSVAVPPTIG